METSSNHGLVIDRLKHPRNWPEGATATETLRLMKVVTIFSSGGTEGQVHNLVRHMDHGRFDLRFACLRKYGHYLKEVEEWGIPVDEFRINSLYKPNTFRQQLRLAGHIRAQRTQIVHSYNFYSNVFAIPAARLAGVPVVLASIRDRGVYLSAAQLKVQKWVCQMADRILVNAESIRDWLLEDGYDPDKIRIIRNGIDLSRFQPAADGGIREEYGISAEAPVVVMLSRLNPLKGIDDYLKAAAILSRRYPEARFLVVGERLQDRDGSLRADHAYHQQLHDLCVELGVRDKVIFTGHRHDVPQVLMQANVSVLPSHNEGLSNSLIESMAAGLPLVATRVGGNPELVRDGENGFLVPVQDPGQLALAIGRIIGDKALEQRFSQASARRSREEFSMEKMVRDTQELYADEWRRHTKLA